MQPEGANGVGEGKDWRDRPRLPFFRKNLSKWVDFHPFKYTVDGIGVFASKLLRVFQ